MRYARTYRDYQLGITSSRPSRDPYAARRDSTERDPSWATFRRHVPGEPR